MSGWKKKNEAHTLAETIRARLYIEDFDVTSLADDYFKGGVAPDTVEAAADLLDQLHCTWNEACFSRLTPWRDVDVEWIQNLDSKVLYDIKARARKTERFADHEIGKRKLASDAEWEAARLKVDHKVQGRLDRWRNKQESLTYKTTVRASVFKGLPGLVINCNLEGPDTGFSVSFRTLTTNPTKEELNKGVQVFKDTAADYLARK